MSQFFASGGQDIDWSFSFSFSPSSEYSGLISFRIHWLDLLAVQGTLKSLPQHHSSKASTPKFKGIQTIYFHHIQELAQTHVHQVSDAIQPSHPLSSPSPPTFSLSQHQGLFQGVSSSYQLAKVLEFQPQHQSFQ